MNLQNDKIRIAVQKRGRLMEPSIAWLESLGFEFKKNGESLIIPCVNADIELLRVRNGDIPQYVKYNVADYGIVGENVLAEKKGKLKIVEKLGFGKCRLVIAVPKGSNIKTVKDLDGERVATSYTRTLRKFLRDQGVGASTVEINGSVEICPSLNLSDAICDITQTGTTLKENGLQIISDVFDSEAVCVESPYLTEERAALFNELLTKRS